MATSSKKQTEAKAVTLIAGALRNTKRSKAGVETHTFIPVAYPKGKTPADYVKIDPIDGHGKASEAILAAMEIWPLAGRDIDWEVKVYRRKLESAAYVQQRCDDYRASIIWKQDVRAYAAEHKLSEKKAEVKLKAERKANEAKRKARAKIKADAAAEAFSE